MGRRERGETRQTAFLQGTSATTTCILTRMFAITSPAKRLLQLLGRPVGTLPTSLQIAHHLSMKTGHLDASARNLVSQLLHSTLHSNTHCLFFTVA